MSENRDGIFRVVKNHEEQYSLWPADRSLPLGWSEAGKTGSWAECCAHIDAVWTDMRPLSLRKRMEAAQGAGLPAVEDVDPALLGEDLVTRLCRGDHPVVVLPPSGATLDDVLRREFVRIRFVGTEGPTELGVRLAREASTPPASGLARTHLEGALTLDGVRVRCTVDVDAMSLEGRGRLSRLDEG
ncbi:MbtH family NRPS accessory protein [Sorangium sp. So ce327]|uniref:MbtH family protein n=1 Tax=unclassified Sorangium TaxID=2621164 RepID=UPI003F5F80B7